MIKPMISDSGRFNELEWNLYKNPRRNITNTEISVIYKDLNNNYSIRFSNYKPIQIENKQFELETDSENIYD